MSFSLVSLPYWSARPGPFTKKFTFKAGTEELEQVVKAVKRAQANQCRIYFLTKNEQNYGLIAVSLSTLDQDEIPILVLDYLFVSLQYRGQVFDELDGLKISDFLQRRHFNWRWTSTTSRQCDFWDWSLQMTNSARSM